MFWGFEVDETGLGLYPISIFGIRDVGPSSCTTIFEGFRGPHQMLSQPNAVEDESVIDLVRLSDTPVTT
jgi:hypothetical protein